jgi:uncharacterized protein (DUF2147 family)
MHSFRSTAALAALLSSFVLASAHAAEPTGIWLTEKQDAHIRIARCGKALCGTIVWIKDKIDPKTGKPPVDVDNPNPRLRHHRIVGLRIFAMTKDGGGQWHGPIYNSDDGQSYASKLIPHGTNSLEVRGCAGLICGSETWHRLGR